MPVVIDLATEGTQCLFTEINLANFINTFTNVLVFYKEAENSMFSFIVDTRKGLLSRN